LKTFSVRRFTFETSSLYSCDGRVKVILNTWVKEKIKIGEIETFKGNVELEYTVYNGNHFIHNFTILSTTCGSLGLDDRNRIIRVLRDVVGNSFAKTAVYN